MNPGCVQIHHAIWIPSPLAASLSTAFLPICIVFLQFNSKLGPIKRTDKNEYEMTKKTYLENCISLFNVIKTFN